MSDTKSEPTKISLSDIMYDFDGNSQDAENSQLGATNIIEPDIEINILQGELNVKKISTPEYVESSNENSTQGTV